MSSVGKATCPLTSSTSSMLWPASPRMVCMALQAASGNIWHKVYISLERERKEKQRRNETFGGINIWIRGWTCESELLFQLTVWACRWWRVQVGSWWPVLRCTPRESRTVSKTNGGYAVSSFSTECNLKLSAETPRWFTQIYNLLHVVPAVWAYCLQPN